MHMTKKMKLAQLTDMLQDLNVEALEGVTIEGDIELDISGGGGLNPELAYAIGNEISHMSLHMANIGRILGFPAEQLLASAFGMGEMPEMDPALARPTELMSSKFDVSKLENWRNKIQ